MLNVTKLFLFAFFLLLTHAMWGQTFEFQIVKMGKNNLTAIEQAQIPDNFLLNFADTANRLRIINKTDETQKVAIVLNNGQGTLEELAEFRLNADTSKIVDINDLKIGDYLKTESNLTLKEDYTKQIIVEYFKYEKREDKTYDALLYPYYDALFIAENYKKSAFKDSINKVLSHYVGKKSIEYDDLFYIYRDNKFIRNALFKNFPELPSIVPQSASATTTSTIFNALSSGAATLGGLNATIYADGIAKFIVKRFKQDLNALFFQKMKEEMAKNEEIQILLPKTYQELKAIDQNIYDFNIYLTGLRERMEEDMTQIFGHATTLLETDKYRNRFDQNPVLGAFLGTVFQVVQGTIQHENVGAIIENMTFSNAYDNTPEGQNMKGGLQTLRLFSIGLRAKNTNPQTLTNDRRDNNKESPYWINGKENVQKLFEGDAFAAKIWFGLMYQLAINKEGNDIVLADSSLRDKINYCFENQAHFYKAREYVTALYSKINRVQENYAQFKPEKEKNVAKENWQNIVSCYESVIDLMEHAPKIIELFDNNAAMTQNWYQGMALARALPTLKAEIEARKYHAAIQHFAPLFKALDMREKFIGDTKNTTLGNAILYDSKDKKNPIRRFVNVEEAQGKYADTYLIADVFIKNLNAPKLSEKSKKDTTLSQEFIKPDYHWIDVFVKYGTFVASMALAENSDEVAAILQTSTLPSGSTLRKSKGVNVMINSYFSFIYSNYYNKNGDYGNLKDGFEISAPVGLSINFGAHKNNRRKDGKRTIVNNWQIFGSLIDVGTLANVRLVDNQTSVPKFTLENIFAPGLTVNMGGLFNSPLTLGAGFQRAPNVLLINGIATKQPTSLRFSLNLSWDIPMWSLKHWD